MKPPYRYFRVVMGTSLLNAGGESHHIARVDVHLDWIDSPKLSYQNDLAIITVDILLVKEYPRSWKLASKIFFNAYKQKAKLPTKEVQDGEVADFTGWGLTLQTPKTRPKNLQRIKTTIVTNEKCRKKMVNGARLMIYKTQVCAFRTSGIGACSGDSGSPLVVNGEIVGIASWVRNKRCANGSPDVYTNVYAYKDYIESIIYRY
ncbi:chymotrypsin-2-like [Phymastichus coffea]|uniref:chymotrypsin-2-like n=1 Tax=Phymastichus coffea TaxID=108790 RepID=UPI00273C29C4|nr:chymotrypsin-2-like [Phymastichus coffea]